jgi:Cd2+/Zn2+-exporting ATPase
VRHIRIAIGHSGQAEKGLRSGDRLVHLPIVIGLGRSTHRIIGQDPGISLGRVAVPVPATLFGLQRGAAAIFHEGSTPLVVANALRLLAHPGPDGRRPADQSISTISEVSKQ